MLLSLLLLIHSLSTAQLQPDSNNEVISHLRQTESQAAEENRIEKVVTKDIRNLSSNITAAFSVSGKQVAFSASVFAGGAQGYVGPFNTDTVLVFRHVATNTGNAYNPHTGIFFAPVRGVYHFEFYLHGHGHASHPTAASLVKNGQQIFTAFEGQASSSVNPSNGVILHLESGDVVFVRLWRNARIYDTVDHHTTFSGHLLFPM
uniref:C1q domain-containing protein n=1 Tax=Poecilia mexicana TaxID=48701 RepID=A0A3B3WUD2_9TELE